MGELTYTSGDGGSNQGAGKQSILLELIATHLKNFIILGWR